jgi:hypothetical protein
MVMVAGLQLTSCMERTSLVDEEDKHVVEDEG